MDLEQHVLHHFFGVLLVTEVTERQLVDLRAVRLSQVAQRRLVARLQPGEEPGILRIAHLSLAGLENTAGRRFIPGIQLISAIPQRMNDLPKSEREQCGGPQHPDDKHDAEQRTGHRSSEVERPATAVASGNE